VAIKCSFLTFTALAVVLACAGEKKPAADSETASPTDGPAAVATSSNPRAAIFQVKGCPQCHSISALGIKSPAEIGPDLTLAYEDVQSRFSMSLQEFLHNPTGTMQVVLSSQIQLSTAERDSIIRILTDLHEESEEEDTDND
jgi:cytochrome c551/c552